MYPIGGIDFGGGKSSIPMIFLVTLHVFRSCGFFFLNDIKARWQRIVTFSPAGTFLSPRGPAEYSPENGHGYFSSEKVFSMCRIIAAISRTVIGGSPNSTRLARARRRAASSVTSVLRRVAVLAEEVARFAGTASRPFPLCGNPLRSRAPRRSLLGVGMSW